MARCKKNILLLVNNRTDTYIRPLVDIFKMNLINCIVIMTEIEVEFHLVDKKIEFLIISNKFISKENECIGQMAEKQFKLKVIYFNEVNIIKELTNGLLKKEKAFTQKKQSLTKDPQFEIENTNTNNLGYKFKLETSEEDFESNINKDYIKNYTDESNKDEQSTLKQSLNPFKDSHKKSKLMPLKKRNYLAQNVTKPLSENINYEASEDKQKLDSYSAIEPKHNFEQEHSYKLEVKISEEEQIQPQKFFLKDKKNNLKQKQKKLHLPSSPKKIKTKHLRKKPLTHQHSPASIMQWWKPDSTEQHQTKLRAQTFYDDNSLLETNEKKLLKKETNLPTHSKVKSVEGHYNTAPLLIKNEDALLNQEQEPYLEHKENVNPLTREIGSKINLNNNKLKTHLPDKRIFMYKDTENEGYLIVESANQEETKSIIAPLCQEILAEQQINNNGISLFKDHFLGSVEDSYKGNIYGVLENHPQFNFIEEDGKIEIPASYCSDKIKNQFNMYVKLKTQEDDYLYVIKNRNLTESKLKQIKNKKIKIRVNKADKKELTTYLQLAYIINKSLQRSENSLQF